MEEISLEEKIARIQKQRLDLQLQEDELLRKFEEEELLKKKATDKVIARVIKILKEGDVSRSQLLTALDKDSAYARSNRCRCQSRGKEVPCNHWCR